MNYERTNQQSTKDEQGPKVSSILLRGLVFGIGLGVGGPVGAIIVTMVTIGGS